MYIWQFLALYVYYDPRPHPELLWRMIWCSRDYFIIFSPIPAVIRQCDCARMRVHFLSCKHFAKIYWVRLLTHFHTSWTKDRAPFDPFSLPSPFALHLKLGLIDLRMTILIASVSSLHSVLPAARGQKDLAWPSYSWSNTGGTKVLLCKYNLI